MENGKCKIKSGSELHDTNDKIVEYLLELKNQRDELNILIRKQEEERLQLQSELERIQHKLKVIAKSITQRLQARERYNIAIQEAEGCYNKIVQSSIGLLQTVQKEYSVLDEANNKKVGTEKVPADESKNQVPKTSKQITTAASRKSNENHQVTVHHAAI